MLDPSTDQWALEALRLATGTSTTHWIPLDAIGASPWKLSYRSITKSLWKNHQIAMESRITMEFESLFEKITMVERYTPHDMDHGQWVSEISRG